MGFCSIDQNVQSVFGHVYFGQFTVCSKISLVQLVICLTDLSPIFCMVDYRAVRNCTIYCRKAEYNRLSQAMLQEPFHACRMESTHHYGRVMALVGYLFRMPFSCRVLLHCRRTPDGLQLTRLHICPPMHQLTLFGLAGS